MSEDITFCGYSKCPNKKCERHQSNIKNLNITHSFAYFHDCNKYPPMEFSQDDIEHKGGESMKYLAVVDDEFLKNFRLDDSGLTLVVHDETTMTRAMPLKPLHRPVLVLSTGDSLYLTQGHIDALVEYEDKKATAEAVRRINEGIQGMLKEYNKKPNVDIITIGQGCIKCPSHARCQDAFQIHSHLCNHYDKTEKEFEDWLKGKHK